ncbi:MAG: flippase [Lachnospiraceae bacterium]|nr:flippase [Lachnospiraceae bacterium]
MAKKIDIKSNIFFNTIKTIFGIIYPLLTFPYISRVLLTENIGKINFGNSIVSYFSLIASLGVTTYAVRECSKYKYNRVKLGEIASQILSINVWTTLVSYIALGITLLTAKSLYNYRLLIIIQSSTILFTTLGADWLNTAMEEFRFIAIRTMGMQLVSVILMLIFVRSPEDYLVYAAISVIASSGANIINIFYRRRYCATRFLFHIDWKKHLPPILLLFSLLLSQTIYTSSDTTILGLIKGDYQVGLYSTSVKIYNIVNSVVASVAWVVMPQLSSEFEKNNYEKINELLKCSLNYIIILGLPCLIGLNTITKEIIILIAGEEYLCAALSLRILTISLACSFISGWIGNMMMLPAGKEKVCLKASVCSAIINVILNLWLIPIWGLNAAAATTAISEFIGIVIKYPYIDKNIKISGLRQMLEGPIIGAVCVALISVAIKYFIESEYLIAIFTIMISIAVYFGVLILMKNEFVLDYVKTIKKKRS